MKILILFLIFLNLNILNAQNVYVSFSLPNDMGLGLRYDEIFKGTGIYVATSKTECRYNDIIIKNHYRISLGGVVNMSNGTINAGLCYHSFGEITGEIDPKALKPISFEIGCIVRFKRFLCGFRFDPLKGTSCIDAGIKL